MLFKDTETNLVDFKYTQSSTGFPSCEVMGSNINIVFRILASPFLAIKP